MIKMSAGLVSPEVSLLGLQLVPSPCVLIWVFSLCTRVAGSLPLLCKTPVLLDQGSTLVTSFNLNSTLKAQPPNTVNWG